MPKRTFMSLDAAIELAVQAHTHQADKAGLPYITHPLRVMLAMGRLDFAAQRVAVLHDVVEDTFVTLGMLEDYGLQARELAAIEALTQGEDEGYHDYIRRLAKDPLAVRVKLADIADNMDPTRPLAEHERDRLHKKYRWALQYLNNHKE